MSALHTLLNGIVDYAGLFPPASLSMSEAVKNYAHYLQSLDRWALARFVVPVSRLEEFTTAVHALTPDLRNQTWRLSALVGNMASDDLNIIADFNHRFSRAPRSMLIDAVELKASRVEEIHALNVSSSLATFIEIPIAGDVEPLIEAIKKKNYRAKVRTGGVTLDAFPSPHALACFIFLCAKHQCAFKATAGLHHPIRAAYRLTYAPDSPSGTMFGFLNVFLASAFAYCGMTEPDLADLLSETDLAQFSFSQERICWRSHCLDTATLHRIRTEFALSFGSCSFEEPIEDLKTHHLLNS
ncbi:MAG: hypothetical protein SNJ55_07980 [Chloroherpetonaceae bacterium]